MNLSYIRYFVELAHVQHYTNAARNLNITQPSLSHAISQLEEELGVMLFEKNGRNTELTAFGREFLACAEHSLGTLDAGVESIQKEAAGDGVIRLGLIRPLGMEFVPRLAAEYLKKDENRNVSFTFHTGTTGQLLDDLAARKYDMVFCSRPPETMGFSAELSENLRKLHVLISQLRHKSLHIIPLDKCPELCRIVDKYIYPTTGCSQCVHTYITVLQYLHHLTISAEFYVQQI